MIEGKVVVMVYCLGLSHVQNGWLLVPIWPGGIVKVTTTFWRTYKIKCKLLYLDCNTEVIKVIRCDYRTIVLLIINVNPICFFQVPHLAFDRSNILQVNQEDKLIIDLTSNYNQNYGLCLSYIS